MRPDTTRLSNLITWLLLAFIAFLPVVVFTFMTINHNIHLFRVQSEAMTRLKLLDKDFHYFIAQKGVFHNYDHINRQIVQFQHELEKLIKIMHDNSAQTKYIKQIDSLKSAFQAKIDLIEDIKAFNSTIINSLNYLHDLEKTIKRRSLVTETQLDLIHDTLFMSMQYYSNNAFTYKQIKQNLKQIKQIFKQTGDKYIKYFYLHEKNLIHRIKNIQVQKNRVEHLNIYDRLNQLHRQLEDDFERYLTLGKTIMLMIVFFLGTLLLMILYLHRKSTEQKKKLHAYKYAIDNSDNSVVITDVNKNITFVNEAFQKETGYTQEEILGKNPRILKSNLLDQSHYNSLNEALRQNRRWEGEFINKRKDGSIYYEKASISPMFIDGKVTGYIAIKLNITKYIEQERKVQFLAYHDPLTTLPNRYRFERYFHEEILGKNRHATLLYIDLDHFKNINDSLGHHTGDALLKTFAKRLQNKLNANDFIARIGGDEFVAVIASDNTETIQEIAQSILESLQHPIEISGTNLTVTTSIGIAIYPQDGKDLETLLKFADTAMYQAKKEGRNNFQFFTQKLSRQAQERLQIEQELRQALQKEELYLVYQPKYSLKNKSIIGFEALIRWKNETLGFVPPDRFIAIAEETGLITQIGYFIFETACTAFHKLKTAYPTLQHIAINVSTVQMRDEHFIETINDICEKSGLAPEDIELELTESYIMENIEQNIRQLAKLRAFGYRIAIDDFGTGYSSFSYLKKLPVTTLKVDKAFIDDISTDKRDLNIVKTIITLAKNLSFDTVAEGIETEQQEALLASLGCDTAQGYLFSKPLDLKSLWSFLENTIKQNAPFGKIS